MGVYWFIKSPLLPATCPACGAEVASVDVSTIAKNLSGVVLVDRKTLRHDVSDPMAIATHYCTVANLRKAARERLKTDRRP